MTDEEDEIRCKIVYKMVRSNVTGSHKVTVDTAVNWVAAHHQGTAKDVIRDMIRGPRAPVMAYGGSRDNVRLSSISDGVDYLKANDCEVPWGYD